MLSKTLNFTPASYTRAHTIVQHIKTPLESTMYAPFISLFTLISPFSFYSKKLKISPAAAIQMWVFFASSKWFFRKRRRKTNKRKANSENIFILNLTLQESKTFFQIQCQRERVKEHPKRKAASSSASASTTNFTCASCQPVSNSTPKTQPYFLSRNVQV